MTTDVRAKLLAELEAARASAAAYLRPELGEPGDQSVAAFFLTEGLLVGRKDTLSGPRSAG